MRGSGGVARYLMEAAVSAKKSSWTNNGIFIVPPQASHPHFPDS
jgi:hypothetical protein